MIQFRRGKTSSWKAEEQKLGQGQPGYDIDQHLLRIGDGLTDYEHLPQFEAATIIKQTSDEPDIVFDVNATDPKLPVSSSVSNYKTINDKYDIDTKTTPGIYRFVSNSWSSQYDTEYGPIVLQVYQLDDKTVYQVILLRALKVQNVNIQQDGDPDENLRSAICHAYGRFIDISKTPHVKSAIFDIFSQPEFKGAIDKLKTIPSDFSNYELKTNKVNTLDTSATHYPSNQLLSTQLNLKLPTTITSINNADLDLQIGKVILGYGNNCTNRPEDSGNGYFINMPHDEVPSKYNKQFWFVRTTNQIFTRNQEDGVFTNWVELGANSSGLSGTKLDQYAFKFDTTSGILTDKSIFTAPAAINAMNSIPVATWVADKSTGSMIYVIKVDQLSASTVSADATGGSPDIFASKSVNGTTVCSTVSFILKTDFKNGSWGVPTYPVQLSVNGQTYPLHQADGKYPDHLFACQPYTATFFYENWYINSLAITKSYVVDSKKEDMANKINSLEDDSVGSNSYPSSIAVRAALSKKEDIANKVDSISSSSTDIQYPSAKLLYDTVYKNPKIPNIVQGINSLVLTGYTETGKSSTTSTVSWYKIGGMVMMWGDLPGDPSEKLIRVETLQHTVISPSMFLAYGADTHGNLCISFCYMPANQSKILGLYAMNALNGDTISSNHMIGGSSFTCVYKA